MRTLIIITLCLFIGFAAVGCADKKAESSQAAISQAQTMQSVDEKVSYLMGQAQAFYNSDDFQNAIEVAQHVLSKLDKNNQQAKDLITQAKEALKAQASKALEDVSGNLKN
jgi:hydroxylamine reductase (hybrid-cluster protein)